MNYKNLYVGEEVNGSFTLYEDEGCTKPYTGHVEEYFEEKLSWECDIVNGLQDGIEKTYYDHTGELESINEMKDNMGNGLAIEYYKNGRIRSVSTLIDNLNIDGYMYNEEGKLVEVSIMNKNNVVGISYCSIKDKIPELREKYNLKELNEEILIYGKPVKYGKPIY